MLPVCPLVSWDSTGSKMGQKPARKTQTRVSRAELPRCLWPRQSHLPAGTRCSTASSPEQFSSPAGLGVPGTLSCPLEHKRDFVKPRYALQRKENLVGAEFGLNIRIPSVSKLWNYLLKQTLGAPSTKVLKPDLQKL